MRKILTAMSLIGAVAFGPRASVASNPSLFSSGAYTGAAVGYSYMNSSAQESILIPGFGIDASDKKKGKRHGLVGELLIGYRHVFPNTFFLGVELGAAKDNNAFQKTLFLDVYEANVKLDRRWQLTPSLVVGKVVSEKWAGFLKVGVPFSKFHLRHSIQLVGGTPRTETQTKTQRGISATVGAEYAFTQHVSAIGTVTYERFNALKKEIAPPLAGSSNRVSVKPYYITAKLGFLYRF